MTKRGNDHPFGKIEGGRHRTYQGGWKTEVINIKKTIVTSATAITVCTVPAGSQVLGFQIKHLAAVTKNTTCTAYMLQWSGATAGASDSIFTTISVFTAGVSRKVPTLDKPGTTTAKVLVLKARPSGQKIKTGKIRIQIHYLTMKTDLRDDPVG